MTPDRPVQIRRPIWDDANDTAYGESRRGQASCHHDGPRSPRERAPRSLPSRSRHRREETLAARGWLPLLARLTPGTDLQKYKWAGTRPYPGLLAKPALVPRFTPVSGSKGRRAVFLQLVAIPVHGYDMDTDSGSVPGWVNLRQAAHGRSSGCPIRPFRYGSVTERSRDQTCATQQAATGSVGSGPPANGRRGVGPALTGHPVEGRRRRYPDGNRPTPLTGTGLAIGCPKGKSVPTFQNQPLPAIACKRGDLARSVPCVLSSKWAEKFPQGNRREFLYTGMASNPALTGLSKT